MCSGVWPGVCHTFTVTPPIWMVSPSRSGLCSGVVKVYCQSGPPSAESQSVAPVRWASSREPLR